ncbi:MAG: hypothetical protein Ct9H90mP9_5340 [Pseudomonadota bacterium]|nr:MAG: hypothetical protein Ct9H90mP9_5340 [Pseudomonadota bacterium]
MAFWAQGGDSALYFSRTRALGNPGLPDLGIITQEELCRAVKSLYLQPPADIVDGDTGYGETLNVMRLVKGPGRSRCRRVQLEDQICPRNADI